MSFADLSDRERRVLAAVIQSYVETAEPAGSRAIARKFGLGVSPATIRNTMSDLEEKGFLFHPHTSAGRVPTDLAYRAYVESLTDVAPLGDRDARRLETAIRDGDNAIEAILRRAAQTLGVLTQELGVALGPRLDQTVLERLTLLRVSSERVILALSLTGGLARTVFVDVPGEIADPAVTEVQRVLNERLAGLTLRDIRASLSARLRDAVAPGSASELMNIFIEEGDQVFDVPVSAAGSDVVLGQPSLLAGHPEFADTDGMRRVMELAETRHRLAEVLRQRQPGPGLQVTIGGEHGESLLERFTVVTAEYHAGSISGVIGVIGPTRMPYDKVISLVTHTSRLVSDLLH
jgi:heat-inducible transcriptional repressor